MYYGFCVTKQGRDLIAKLVAGKKLELSRIMVGSGCCPDADDPRLMTDLAEPVAAATSTTPVYGGAEVKMVVEYRSDLNGGLDHGFWLREFGIYAYDPDDGEVLIYYGALGDYPQWVGAYSPTSIDVRRFPVCIVIGDDSGVEADYQCEAWMTAEDVEIYCNTVMLPLFLAEAKKLMDTHDVDPDAHFSIQNLVSGIDARLALLELMYNTNVDGNPFTVTFETLDGVTLEGIWNEAAKRVDF